MQRRTSPACEGRTFAHYLQLPRRTVAKLDRYVLDVYARDAFDAIDADLAGTCLVIRSLYPTTHLGVGPFKASMACLDLCINRHDAPDSLVDLCTGMDLDSYDHWSSGASMVVVAATPSFYLDGKQDRRYMDVCIKLALEMGPYGHYTLLRRFYKMEYNFRRGDQGNIMLARWCNAFKAAWEAAVALLGDDVDPKSLHSKHSTSVPTHASSHNIHHFAGIADRSSPRSRGARRCTPTRLRPRPRPSSTSSTTTTSTPTRATPRARRPSRSRRRAPRSPSRSTTSMPPTCRER